MLVIANGAFKNGSTWLFNILKCMTDFPAPPDKYLNPDWVNPSLRLERLHAFLKNEDFVHNDYLVKNHFSSERTKDLLLRHDEIFIFDITRDLRDVIVSAYYHDVRENNYWGNFRRYYYIWGRLHAIKNQEYHELWNIDSDQVYVSSFDQLKNRFFHEVKSIGNILRRSLNREEVKRIKRDTSLSSLREKYGEKGKKEEDRFFRKGEQGTWKNHFDHRILQDLKQIKTYGIGPERRSLLRMCKRIEQNVFEATNYFRYSINGNDC